MKNNEMAGSNVSAEQAKLFKEKAVDMNTIYLSCKQQCKKCPLAEPILNSTTTACWLISQARERLHNDITYFLSPN
jgi:hypothetical protein